MILTQKRIILARKFRFEFDRDDFDQDDFDHNDFLSGQFRFDPESLTPTVDWAKRSYGALITLVITFLRQNDFYSKTNSFGNKIIILPVFLQSSNTFPRHMT